MNFTVRIKKILIPCLFLLAVFFTTASSYAYWASAIMGTSKDIDALISTGSWDPNTIIITEDNEFNFVEIVNESNEETKIILTKDVEINIDKPLDPFQGEIDGQGFVVKNEGVISKSSDETPGGRILIGLFSMIEEGSTVKNLVLENIVIDNCTVPESANSNNYGAILAAYNFGTIENVAIKGGSVNYCYSNNSSNTIYVHASGMVGENGPSGIIRNSYSTATSVSLTVNKTGNTSQTIYGYVGGLVGKNVQGRVENSYSTAAITGTANNSVNRISRIINMYAGGLIGYSDGGTVNYSFVTGDISATGNRSNTRTPTYAGRIIGNNVTNHATNHYLSGQYVFATNTNNVYSNQGRARNQTYLYNQLTNWDNTGTIWVFTGDSYPTLKMEEEQV